MYRSASAIFSDKTIADLVVVFHVLFITLFIGGVVFSFVERAYAPYHVVLVVITSLINVIFDGCPFTKWEKKYRLRHDSSFDYKSSFYSQYFFWPIFRVNPSAVQVRTFLFITKVVPGLIPLLIVFEVI